jgi:hypothetical protein
MANSWDVFPTYCERNTKYTKMVYHFFHSSLYKLFILLCDKIQNNKNGYHFSHFSLYKLFILLCDKIQNNKNGISFLSLFIIQIICSIVRENKNIQILDTISLTFHYTYYLFYCVTKYKTYKIITYHFSHSSLYKLFILLCDKIQNNKNGISFLSLFIIQIIYSIVREIQKHTNIITISLTLYYTNYLSYCERKQKHTNHFSHSSLYILFILLCDKYKNIQTISLTLHYRYYLFYCERKQKHTNIV